MAFMSTSTVAAEDFLAAPELPQPASAPLAAMASATMITGTILICMNILSGTSAAMARGEASIREAL
jgi:hypothetical protein